MSNGYRLIFWGVLLILIDFRIGSFDILPDFIGYIYIVNGLSSLRSKHQLFEKARPYAILLIFLALPNFIGVWETSLNDLSIEIIPMLYLLITGLLHLVMMYYIFEGTYQLAIENDDETWAAYARTRWNSYAVVQILLFVMTSFMFNIEVGVLQGVFFILVIVAFVIEIIIVVFMRKSQHRSEEWEGNGL